MPDSTELLNKPVGRSFVLINSNAKLGARSSRLRPLDPKQGERNPMLVRFLFLFFIFYYINK